jgi:hypothetical protein
LTSTHAGIIDDNELKQDKWASNGMLFIPSFMPINQLESTILMSKIQTEDKNTNSHKKRA